MNQLDPSQGIDGLIRPTANLVDATLTSSRSRRHVEYLPYPDQNFVEEIDPQSDGYRPLEDVYLRRNRTFVSGQSVEVIELTGERIYNPVTEFLNPFL